jgi:hypothetical protein
MALLPLCYRPKRSSAARTEGNGRRDPRGDVRRGRGIESRHPRGAYAMATPGRSWQIDAADDARQGKWAPPAIMES